MKQKKPNKEFYTPPVVTLVEIETLQMLAMSGQGTDTSGDHDFGGRGANERRGTWGNLWE